MLVLIVGDSRAERVRRDHSASDQYVSRCHPGVDDADNGGFSVRRQDVGELVYRGIEQLRHRQCRDWQHVDAGDHIEFGQLHHAACRDVHASEEQADRVANH